MSAACGAATHSGAGQGGSASGASGDAGDSSTSSGGSNDAAGAGTGGSTQLPGATEREDAVLAALFFAPATFAAAELGELSELAAKVALARGYAMCRCVRSPVGPPNDMDHLLTACAPDEGGVLRNFLWYPSPEQGPRANQDLARCLAETPDASPLLEDALRCELERYQRDGRSWLALCSIPNYQGESSAFPSFPAPCAQADDFQKLLETCQFAGYCSDGTRMALTRCDEAAECADGSDEQGCFEIVGHDMLQCNDEVRHAASFCEHTTCGYQSQPPLCDAARTDRFLCADGTDIPSSVVCDRKADCTDGADEQRCLR